MKNMIASTVLATAMAVSGLFLGATAASAAQTPQQAADQGVSAAAGQGYNQHVSVRDRSTGALLAQSVNANEPTASESLVKLFTAAHEIVTGYGNYQNVPASELNALAYMIEYSDDASENARFTTNDVPWVVSNYGLSGNTANAGGGNWGSTSITANDESLFLYRVLQDPAVGPWMTAVMAQAQPNGSDGFNQNYGFNALGGVHGSKQGWGSDGFGGQANTISSVGYTASYVGAILTTVGHGGGYTEMEAPDTFTAQLIQGSSTPQATPPPAPAPRNVVQDITNFAAANGRLTISGWAFDPASPGRSTTVTLYVSGRAPILINADMPQAYVNGFYHVPGDHGFSIRLLAGPGTYTVKFAAHAAVGSSSNAEFSRSLTSTMAAPVARSLDSAVAAGGRVTVSGWAYDPTNPLAATIVTIYIDGKDSGRVAANRPDSSVNRSQGVPGNHGVNVRLLIRPGRHHIVFSAHALPGSSSIAGMSRTLTVG